MRAYTQSKIASGLFGLELDRRSQADGWGITSNLSHPGVAPTNLLAARPELGRDRDTRAAAHPSLSARGILAAPSRPRDCPPYGRDRPRGQARRLYGPSGLQTPRRPARRAAAVRAAARRRGGRASGTSRSS